MGWYNDNLLPRVIDKVLDTGEARKHRSHVVPKATGRVLEIGFGSGPNLAFYGGDVMEVLAVDPSLKGRELAEERIEGFDRPVRFVGLDGQRLDVPDNAVDSVVSTWTLCTIPDPAAALVEVRRVLKPGGRFYFCEHGRHPEPTVASWQDRLDRVWPHMAGGCHLGRRIADLVADAGFEPEESAEHMMKQSPRWVGYLYEGVAVAP